MSPSAAYNLLPGPQGCYPVCERYCVTVATATVTTTATPLLNSVWHTRSRKARLPAKILQDPESCCPHQEQPWHCPDFSISKTFQATTGGVSVSHLRLGSKGEGSKGA